MKARCPNDPSHKRFMTVATIHEDWIVDDEGNFIDTAGTDPTVLERPKAENLWVCQECGEQAEVK